MCEKATKSRGYVQIDSTAANRDVNIKVSSDAGKRKVSEAVTPERASPVRKHSQQFPHRTKLLATKSSRKNLFSSMKTNMLVKETRLTDSKTPQPLSLERHEQSS